MRAELKRDRVVLPAGKRHGSELTQQIACRRTVNQREATTTTTSTCCRSVLSALNAVYLLRLGYDDHRSCGINRGGKKTNRF